MKSVTTTTIVVWLALAASQAAAQSHAALDREDENLITDNCESERQRLEHALTTELKECDIEIREHSVEHYMASTAIQVKARNAMCQQARREMFTWPRSTNWLGFPEPYPEDPWNDPRFDRSYWYQYYLRKFGEEASRPYLENARQRRNEAQRAFDDAVSRLEADCAQEAGLLREAQERRREQEGIAAERDRRSQLLQDEQDRVEREIEDLADQVEYEREVIDLRQEILDSSTQSTVKFNEFLAGVEEEPLPRSGAAIEPGRFDPPRIRWEPNNIPKWHDPYAVNDSLETFLETMRGPQPPTALKPHREVKQ